MKEFKIQVINEDINKIVQKELIRLGCKWWMHGKKVINDPISCYKNEKPTIHVKDGIMQYSPAEYYDPSHYGPWVTIDQLFEMKPPKPTQKFKISADYTAVFSEEGIEVGCTKITYGQFDGMQKIRESFKD